MILSPELRKKLDLLKKKLHKKELKIEAHKKEIDTLFKEMVDIKNYLGILKDDSNIKIKDRAKIFIDKLKELEVIGEKNDKSVQEIKNIKNSVYKDLDIFITTVHEIESHDIEHVRNYVYQYIEINRINS